MGSLKEEKNNMDFVVYILFSDHLQKYYVGQTSDLEKRILDHNLGKSAFTSKGIPWKLVHIFACSNRSEAIRLETSIKRRGIKRYLQDKSIL
jgi:putative endonuclease